MIEAVCTCVNYGDFLAATLPTNRYQFDRMVVVTAPEDTATQRVCEFNNVQVVLTDSFNTRWGEFCKGCGINDGLEELGLGDWVVHLDADIVLPPLTKQLIEQANLDKSMIYGADRHILDEPAWQRHQAMPRLQQEDNVYVHVDQYPLGTRIATSQYGGYLPIGFFQLWNAGASGVKRYPDQHTDAGRTDMLFAAQWPRAKRALLPELVVYHLESEPGAMQGANWAGRKTKPFGAAVTDLVPASNVNVLPEHRKPHHRKRHHHHHHYHAPEGS
jgi:hypothetical protein